MPATKPKINPRSFWRPKIKEVPQQCVSCPFRQGNDAEFGVVVQRLRKMKGIKGRMTAADIAVARHLIEQDVSTLGDFMCHCTVYAANGKLKPRKEWRQCKGASDFYRQQTA